MSLVDFLTYSLLLFRIAILPFMAGAVMFYVRNRIAGDRRQRHAALAGLGVGLAGLAAVCFRTPLPLAGAIAPFQLAAELTAVLCAGAVVWVSGYAGMLLGDNQGGYWTRPNSRVRSAVLAGLVGAGLSLLFSLPFFAALDIPLAPGQIPSTPAEWGGFLCKKTAHSFGEEVFFRGWCLVWLGALGGRFRLGFWSANLLTAALFSVQHAEGGLYQMLTAFWSGVILGVIFQRHGLFAAAGTHLLLNLLVLVFPWVG